MCPPHPSLPTPFLPAPHISSSQYQKNVALPSPCSPSPPSRCPHLSLAIPNKYCTPHPHVARLLPVAPPLNTPILPCARSLLCIQGKPHRLGTCFDALTWSCSPPELVVAVSFSVGTTSLSVAFPAILVLFVANRYHLWTSHIVGTRPATLLVAIWSPEHWRPSFLLLCFLFMLRKTMNSVSRFFSIFIFPTHSRKTEPPLFGNAF